MPLEPGLRISPSPESVEIVRATLRRMGFGLSAADARSLIEAVLAVEGPKLHLLVRGTVENSLEIIRDTAESALGRVQNKRAERSDLVGGGGRPMAPRRPEPVEEELEDDEPRPVFKRPRR